MPPVNQGSRSGLITAIVIFAILFVAATISAIVFGVKWSKAEQLAELNKKRYVDIVPEAALSGADVQALVSAAKDDAAVAAFGLNSNMKAMDVAIAQRDALARSITGTGANAIEAKAAADAALASATAKVQPAGVSIPADNLAGATDALASAVEAKEKSITDLNAQLTSERAKVTQQASEFAAALQARDKAVDDVRSSTQKQVDEAASDRTAKQSQVDSIEGERANERTQSQEAINALQVQLQTQAQETAKLRNELAAARERVAANRVDVREPVVRQADGTVVRVPGGGIVYINLGHGDQITPGLTFEVYDKIEGVPGVPEGDEADLTSAAMPVGKGSIEVINVGPSSSECRIIKQQPGTTISDGDLIANIVYDPNTKYNFRVYGNFDMDGNGVATPGDAEIIKRLITQWGGNITDRVGVDTDFIVLGKEPVLPTFTQDELADAFNQQKLATAQVELDAYLDVVNRAQDLHIPILNQNRFLYFVGYFDQARR
jgi:hypothetical protein